MRDLLPARRGNGVFENEKSCRTVAAMILNYGRKLCVPSNDPCAKRESSNSCGFSFLYFVCSRRPTTEEGKSVLPGTDGEVKPNLCTIRRMKDIFIFIPKLGAKTKSQRQRNKWFCHRPRPVQRAFPISNEENSKKYRTLLPSAAGMRAKLISLFLSAVVSSRHLMSFSVKNPKYAKPRTVNFRKKKKKKCIRLLWFRQFKV